MTRACSSEIGKTRNMAPKTVNWRISRGFSSAASGNEKSPKVDTNQGAEKVVAAVQETHLPNPATLPTPAQTSTTLLPKKEMDSSMDSSGQESGSDKKSCALVVLNQPIFMPITQFKHLWSSASFIVCADGGANQLFAYLKSQQQQQQERQLSTVVSPPLVDLYLPNLITGDLDSLDESIASFYTSKGVSIERNDCQDTTDFQKCLLHPLFPRGGGRVLSTKNTNTNEEEESIENDVEKEHDQDDYIYVLGGLSGRLDHCMSALHTLLLYPTLKLILLSQDSAAWLLNPWTRHVIYSDPLVEADTCALFPLGAAVAVCKTEGLQWNLDHSMPMEFGHLISTSNKFATTASNPLSVRVVGVETTNTPLIWTVEMRK